MGIAASERPRAWPQVLVACLALGFVACASAGGALHARRAAVEPTPREASMLDDYADGSLDRTSTLEAALMVGGPRDPSELEATARALDAALDAVVREFDRSEAAHRRLPTWVGKIDAARRGRALLAALYAPHGGRALLRRYEADATTLYDVATTGHYNCVSATILYLLAAERAHIDARPVLLPSHARAVVVIEGRRIPVETTTATGFNPSAEVLQQMRMLGRKASEGTLAENDDEEGVEVPFSALLGATYGNLGIMAMDRGDNALAASLVTRQAKLTPKAAISAVQAQQVALLMQLAAREERDGRLDAALGFARRAAAVEASPEANHMAQQLLLHVASQLLVDRSKTWSDAKLIAFADGFREQPLAYGDVRALALSFVGERQLVRGDVAAGTATLARAAGVATSKAMRDAATRGVAFGELARVGKRSETDPEGAWTAWKALPASSNDPEFARDRDEIGAYVGERYCIHLANGGRCSELEVGLTEAPSVPRQGLLRASCRARRAQALANDGKTAAALAEGRDALRLMPGNPDHRKLLVYLLSAHIEALITAGRCAHARPLITEGLTLAPKETFFVESDAYCRTVR